MHTKKETAKMKHDRRKGYKIARFDEQADILEDEIDDIDEEFKALFSPHDDGQNKIKAPN